MSRKFSQKQQILLNQLVVTSELRHLTERESLTYIRRQLGIPISRRTYYQIKKALYEKDILRKSSDLHILDEKPLLPETRYLNLENAASRKYSNAKALDFYPEHLCTLFSDADDLIVKSRIYFARHNDLKETSTKNYESVPANATIRKEYIRCGKHSCYRCRHGPYYYAYWREKGRLKKKYIGKYDPREDLELIDLEKLKPSYEL